MALDPTVLKALIVSKVEAATGATVPAAGLVVYQAIAEAVVAHLVAAGQVAVVVDSVTGVTPGPGASGPGTGTGTIS